MSVEAAFITRVAVIISASLPLVALSNHPFLYLNEVPDPNLILYAALRVAFPILPSRTRVATKQRLPLLTIFECRVKCRRALGFESLNDRIYCSNILLQRCPKQSIRIDCFVTLVVSLASQKWGWRGRSSFIHIGKYSIRNVQRCIADPNSNGIHMCRSRKIQRIEPFGPKSTRYIGTKPLDRWQAGIIDYTLCR